MKKYLPLIAGVCALFFGASIVLALNNTDYKATIATQLEQSQRLHEQARNTACEYIGNLTSTCYKKKATACAELDLAEKEYVRAFGANAYDTCFTAEQSPPAPDDISPKTATSNPLFFDEAGVKQ